jgi:phosphate ABC transporter phosphate-binding protein
VCAAAACVALLQSAAWAQAAAGAQQIHAVYVAPLGQGGSAEAVRRRLIERLKKSAGVRVVDDAKSADAVLHGDVAIWQTGSVSVDPRSNSAVVKNYQGYLSAELKDRSEQPVWSYLVTPSRFRMLNIVDDLADQMGARLGAAIEAGIASGIASSMTPAAARAGAGVTLRVAGATFPAPLYQLWFRSFGQAAGGVAMSYDAVGSAAGVEGLAAGKVDMAASDIPSQRDAQARGTDVLHIPTVVGGVVPVYNLPGETEGLNLTPQVLADIFSGKIRSWNDAAIREWNKGARLPDAEIVVVHRSDGSGTTYVWTSYLAEQSAEWKGRVGATVDWPVGVGAAGNEGVAERVARTPNAISYVELTYAIQHEMTYAAVRNPAGRFVRADVASIAAAVATHTHTGEDDLRYSALNAAAKDAYPITSFTWFLVPNPKTGGDAQRRAAIAAFLRWMLTTGQKQCSALGYAPLPGEVVKEELAAVEGMR